MKGRWEKKKLIEVTGFSQTPAQVRWFKEHLKADVPADNRGVIMNDQTYQLMLNIRCGIHPQTDEILTKKKPSLRI